MSLRWPVSPVNISQGFGGNAAYYKQFGQIGHNGIDIAVPTGTPVFAADDGTIVFEGWGQNHSWMGTPAGICILQNVGGAHVGYAHLLSTLVNKGQSVKKGQLIGYTDTTGAATGPHIHFEMLPLAPNFQNGYAGRINLTQYIDNQQENTKVAIIENADNWRGRVGATFRAIRGRDMSEGEFQSFVGKDTLALIEALEDNPEAVANQNYAALGRTVAAENWGQQIANRTAERDAALAEVEKLKASQGDIDQGSKDSIAETNAAVKWIKDLLSSVFNRSK